LSASNLLHKPKSVNYRSYLGTNDVLPGQTSHGPGFPGYKKIPQGY